MANYHNPTTDQVVYTEQDLAKALNMALPANITPELIEPLGWYFISATSQPAITNTQKAVRSELPVHSNGVSAYQWTVTSKSQGELGDAVNAERDRRLEAGVTVNVTGYGDIPIQGRAVDQINTLALADTARDLIAAGVTDAIIPFRDADNVLHTLTPAQVKELTDKGKSAASAIYQVAWAMKDGTGDFTDGIPLNFTADEYWT